MYRNSLFTLASIFLLLVMFSGCKKDAVPCPECPGFVDGQQSDLDRLYILYQSEEIFGATTFTELSYLVQRWACDPKAPDYEECVIQKYLRYKFSNFLEHHRLNLDLEQFLNDIRENCLISSLNDNECMWNAIQSKAYQTNISYQEFATDVLPFLEGTGLYYENLINANVDVKGCLASGDFGGCAWEDYIDEFAENLRVSEDAENFILNNPAVDGRIEVRKLDWGTLSDTERVNHIFEQWYIINKYHLCLHYDVSEDLNLTYNMNNLFFTNVSGLTTELGGGASWVREVEVTFFNQMTQNDVTIPVTFQWILFNDAQEFLWEIRQSDSAIPGTNLSDWYALRPAVPESSTNGVFIFTAQDADEVEIYTHFRECQ